jgi:hypothetical protein
LVHIQDTLISQWSFYYEILAPYQLICLDNGKGKTSAAMIYLKKDDPCNMRIGFVVIVKIAARWH